MISSGFLMSTQNTRSARCRLSFKNLVLLILFALPRLVRGRANHAHFGSTRNLHPPQRWMLLGHEPAPVLLDSLVHARLVLRQRGLRAGFDLLNFYTARGRVVLHHVSDRPLFLQISLRVVSPQRHLLEHAEPARARLALVPVRNVLQVRRLIFLTLSPIFNKGALPLLLDLELFELPRQRGVLVLLAGPRGARHDHLLIYLNLC